MKNRNVLTIVAIGLFFISCKEDIKKDEAKNKKEETKDFSENYNISILLDLSDRISPEKYPNKTMEYFNRDVGYINSISEAFTTHLQSKKVRQAEDKIQLFFDPAPFNPAINSISKKLKIEVNKDNISKNLIEEINTLYSSEPSKIYQLAIKDNNYVGSDIWKFFKNKVNDYCIEDGYRNILIVLTDGYIYYEDSKIKEGNETTYLTPEIIRKNALNTADWNKKMESEKIGFINIDNDLSNLEVLVLGINADTKNPYEEEVIKAYWTKWLEAMKVKNYDIRNADLPSDMDNTIKKFILNSKTKKTLKQFK